MLRAYMGKFSFVAIVVTLFAVAWALEGVEFGQDLAGGAELRYGVTARMSERFAKLKQWQLELSDPAKREEKERRVREIDEDLKTATGNERGDLKREKDQLEFALNPEELNDAIQRIRERQRELAKGAEVVRRRLDRVGTKNVEVRTIGTDELLIRIPFARDPGQSEEEARAAFEREVGDIKRLVERQGVLNFHIGLTREADHEEYENAAKNAEEGRAMPEERLYALPQAEYEEVVKKLKDRGIDDPLEAGYLPWSKPPETAGKREQRTPLVLKRKPELKAGD